MFWWLEPLPALDAASQTVWSTLVSRPLLSVAPSCLDEFVKQHGETKANAVPFDIAIKEDIPGFAEKITQSYPDVDLEKFYGEINVNFLSSVALAHAFLPFLLQKQTPTSLIFTTSNLAVVPAVKFPAYSASKAAMNTFILCLREQLRNSNVKVIEISPPLVQTELHDYMGKDIGRNLGMPSNALTEEAWKGLESGQDQIMVGTVGPEETFYGVVNQRRTLINILSRRMLGED